MKLKLLCVGGGVIDQIRKFGSILVADAYSDEKEIGFDIVRLTANTIQGKYLEKRTRRIQVFSVTGESSYVEIPSINIIQFVLYARFNALVVLDPVGSIAPFISRLSSLSEFQLTAETLEVPVQLWINFFGREGYSLSVKEVVTAHLLLEDDVEATIRLRGNVDVSTVTSGQFLDKKGDVVSAQLHCTSKSKDFVFTWKNIGNYEFDPAPEDEDLITSLLNFLTTL